MFVYAQSACAGALLRMRRIESSASPTPKSHSAESVLVGAQPRSEPIGRSRVLTSLKNATGMRPHAPEGIRSRGCMKCRIDRELLTLYLSTLRAVPAVEINPSRTQKPLGKLTE